MFLKGKKITGYKVLRPFVLKPGEIIRAGTVLSAEMVESWGNRTAFLSEDFIGPVFDSVSSPPVDHKDRSGDPPVAKKVAKAKSGSSCPICGKVMKNERAVKIHIGRYHK